MKLLIFTGLLIAFVLFAPFWMLVLLCGFGIVTLRAYGAVIGSTFLYDALYYGGTLSEQTPLAIMIPLSVYALALSVVVLLVRERLRAE